MRFVIAVFLVVSLISCGPGMNKILKSKDAAYKLKMAEQFYAKKKWMKAYTIYEDVMPYYKTTPQFQDIYYKYAYTAFNQKDYTNAENLFKQFIENFPNSPRAEEIEYMRAYTFYLQSPKADLDQTNTYKAISNLQTFVNTRPQSVRVTEANRLIDELRKKLEIKDYKSAMLYYNIGEFRAAGVTFNTLFDNYPESLVSDEYKFMAVKSYFKAAELTIVTKRVERYREVIEQANEFIERFPESKYRKDIDSYISTSNTEIQKFSNNEQVKTTT
ncbi:MAG TPA: outer membrane protein assembly factor BamD [Niabella sp.]|nr:outer membrane protein assembly factor BamD [Niabella sp.]